MVLRISALYMHNRAVIIGLYILFIATHITTASLSVVALYRFYRKNIHRPNILVSANLVLVATSVYNELIGLCAAKASRILGLIYLAPVSVSVIPIVESGFS